jgi:hypothetical protein
MPSLLLFLSFPILKIGSLEFSFSVCLGDANICFCQFKIDQARQLNFDQGLKPVFWSLAVDKSN